MLQEIAAYVQKRSQQSQSTVVNYLVLSANGDSSEHALIDTAQLPPDPPLNHVRLVLVSDTHLRHNLIRHKIPNGDIFIHAGDFFMNGRGDPNEMVRFFHSLPHKHKIYVAGNHDRPIVNLYPHKLEQMLRSQTDQPDSVIAVLHNSCVTIEGLRFWGSPFSFNSGSGNDAFQGRSDSDLDQVLATLPAPTQRLDVQISHTQIEPQASSLARLLVHGHFHRTSGFHMDPVPSNTSSSTRAPRHVPRINVTSCDQDYRPTNPPFVVDMERPKRKPSHSVLES